MVKNKRILGVVTLLASDKSSTYMAWGFNDDICPPTTESG